MRWQTGRFLTVLFSLILAATPAAKPCAAAEPVAGHAQEKQTAVTAADIEQLLDKITRETNPQLLEKLDRDFVALITSLHNQKKLKPILYEVGKRAQAAGKMPAVTTSDELGKYIDRLDDMIEAERQAHGQDAGLSGSRHRSWSELCQVQANKTRKSVVRRAGPNIPSSFTNPKFLVEFEDLIETEFFPTDRAAALVNGTASFSLKKTLMEGARKKIHLASWTFEDDVTGGAFAKLLVQRFRDGIDVRVVVDGKTADLPGHHKNLEIMEKAGIPVIRWQNPKRPYFGMHRALLIVDDEHLIAGGMSFGDVYSHLGAEKSPKWRDSDVHLQGAAAPQADKHFARIWNEQVESRGLNLAKVQPPDFQPPEATDNATPLVAIIDHAPNPEGDDPVLLAVLKGIEGSTTSVDIANAYYLGNPALQEALLDALERGVKVRVFTNSAESVDQPIMAKPILSSLSPLAVQGVKVYLKNGATLHSKVMVLDGLASYVMSYDFHPQALLSQGEVALVVLDKTLAGQLTEAYEKDLAGARKVTEPASLKMKDNPLDLIVSRYFFDQL